MNQMSEEERRDLSRTYFYLNRGIDYFDFFRRGDVRNWSGSARREVYRRFRIPYNSTPQPDIPNVDPGLPIPERNYRPFSRIRRIDDGAGRTVEEGMRRNIESLGWRLVKVLGAGSQGLAVLFESANNGRKAVFKYSSEIFDTAVEMWSMRQMVGARHIIQVRLRVLLGPSPPIPRLREEWQVDRREPLPQVYHDFRPTRELVGW